MATLFAARHLCPIGRPELTDAALLVDKGRIVALGRRKELAAACPHARLVDFGEAVILPPMANAHTHLELTHFPRWAAALGETEPAGSFVEWIQRVIRVKRGQPQDLIPVSLAAGIHDCLASGTAMVADMLSYYPARSAYSGEPLRGRLFYEVLGRESAKFRWLVDAVGQLVEEGLVGWLVPGVAPHSPYTLSFEYLQVLCNISRRHRLPMTVHLAESHEEVRFLRESSGPIAEQLYPFVGWESLVPPAAGKSPVEVLADAGGLSPQTLLVHGVQLDARDIELVARSGAGLVLCPRSNAALGVGKAPLKALRAANIPLALGTDSRASVGSLSLWDEIAFARSWFGAEADPRFLLNLATRGGARLLGLERSMGTLSQGGGAHFQVVRLPRSLATEELYEYLCSGVPTAAVALYLEGERVLDEESAPGELHAPEGQP